MDVILDTSFIISCIRNKIRFLDDLKNLVYEAEIVVPLQVIAELDKVADNKKLKIKDREAAALGLQILKDVRTIELEKKYVDKGILEYVKNNPDIYVATLDKKLKQQSKDKTKIITIRAKKKLIIV